MDIFGDAHQGVMHFRGGEIAYLEVDKENGEALVRYESGWLVSYRLDGTRIRAGYIFHKDGTSEEVVGNSNRDVIRFEPITWQEAKAAYPGIQGELPP